MSDMPLIYHYIFAFIATVGWGVFFNVPKEDLVSSSVNGALGWVVYCILQTSTENPAFSNFIASLLVTLISEFLARKLRKPAILFIIPGIIPLVPGFGMYNTMIHMVQGSYVKAIEIGTTVGLVSGAIVLGILVSTSIVKLYYRCRKKMNCFKINHPKKDSNKSLKNNKQK